MKLHGTKWLPFAVALLAAISGVAHAQQVPLAESRPVPMVAGLTPQAQAAAGSISADRIRAHVRYLSLDLLEGRGPGTRGDQLAAEYIATQFALDGLLPAGDNGSYFQQVPLFAVHTDEQKTHFAFKPEKGAPLELAYGTDVVSKDQTGAATAHISAPIIFVGYGITAPEYNWNDYAGVDVKGKVVLVVVSDPPSTDAAFFKGEALTYYGRWTYKYEEAARRGAVGVLLIHRRDLAAYGWDVVRNSQAIEKSYLASGLGQGLRAAAWISHDSAQKLLTAAGLGNVDEAIAQAGRPGAFHATDLHVRLEADVVSQVRHYNSTNIVARRAGAARGQAILYSAHYDHLGMESGSGGDRIYNGAADNATGCGILLEMAHAYSSVQPPHDVYFMSPTAEEQGLLGSEFFGRHLPLPASQIALDLNYDMLLPIGLARSAQLEGAERVDLWPTAQATATAFGLKLEPEAEPSAGHYYRSDHFSLARVGIPAFSLGQGLLFEGHDEAWGRAQLTDFVAHHYHQPTDEFQPGWDFSGTARLAQLGFALGWQASAQPHSVAWQPGDEFEAVRKQSLKN